MNRETEELYEACAGGDVQNTKRVLAKAPDVNSREWDSRFTPLHVCIAGKLNQEQRREIVRLLCKAGARLDLKDERGWSPLLFAAVRDKSLCAEALLECGADVHAANEDRATALHHAAFQGNVEVAKVLLRFGADAAREDANGCTPPASREQPGPYRAGAATLGTAEAFCKAVVACVELRTGVAPSGNRRVRGVSTKVSRRLPVNRLRRQVTIRASR